MPITLEQAVSPAIEQLAAAHLKYLSSTNPHRIAQDIIANPFRSGGVDPTVLAQSRVTNSRHSKIGKALASCCYLLASHHEGVQVQPGSGVVSFEYWHPDYRLVVATQSRESTLNQGVQAPAKRRQLLAACNTDAERPNRAVVILCAEALTDDMLVVGGDGIITVSGQLALHWLSGDPDCFTRLQELFEARLSTVEISIAERRFRHAVEMAILEAQSEPTNPEAYNRARRELEHLLGPSAPVLVERVEPVVLPPDIWDLFDEAAALDAAEE